MFIGRKKELNIFKNKIKSNNFEFGLLYGRRRVGKTKLLKEICKLFPAIYFVADESGLSNNLKQLSKIIAHYF